jgi:transcriptional regulator with XRE-family HTH domain
MPEKLDPARIDEGLRLSTARRHAGLDQREVAERLRINPQTVSRWERGLSAVHPAMRQQLARLLQVEAASIWPAVSTGVVSRETGGVSLAEAARWGYVQAARDLLNRALAETGIEAPPAAQPLRVGAALADAVEVYDAVKQPPRKRRTKSG